jgi:hypothetical protein
MNRYRILKIALACSGTTVTDLANRFGVALPTITQVAQGVKHSRRIEALIDAFSSQAIRRAGIDIGRKAA